MANILSDLTSTIITSLSSLPPPDQIQDAERMQLLSAINRLQETLEPPAMAVQRMGLSVQPEQYYHTSVIRKTKGVETLLKRVMRVPCAHRVNESTAAGTYRPLPPAMALTSGSLPDNVIEHLYKNPESQHAFNVTMTATEQDGADYWFDVYPVTETLTSPDPDRVLLVDIGGGVGHTLAALKRRFPDLSGRLILEDLPQVIDDIKEPLPENVSAIKHSMFEPQPTRDAKVYYMRRVLHDWPNKQALMALSRTREAMAEDSMLIIHDYTFPDGHDGPDVIPFAAIVDFQLMELMSSHERTQQQWVTLLEKAGFKVAKVYMGRSNALPSAIFEATL
ncbi:S-adenosyl-L-methionine-dependent methyltransferase [Aspergillus desertorum]